MAVLGGDLDQVGKRLALASVPLDAVLDGIAALSAAKEQAVARRRDLEGARTAAQQAEETQRALLEQLGRERAEQQRLLDGAADRLDRALAESDALAGRDAELAEQLRARQAELAARLAAATPPHAPVPAVAASPDPAAEAVAAAAAAETADSGDGDEVAAPVEDGGPVDGSGDGPAAPEDPSGSAETAPQPDAPPPPPPPTSSSGDHSAVLVPVDTAWVGGIEVAASIAGQVAALLAAAAADGLVLSGSGYRSIYEQIAIRREICGPTDYDIWDRPSWECSPPVARPGRSNHEKGLAIDFTGPNGDLVRSQDSPTFIWLWGNAARFGLYNLPSEPWHWSTTGG